MSLLLESIRLDNGQFPLLTYHQSRVDRSCNDLFGKSGFALEDALRQARLPQSGVFKCRLVYNESGIEKIECTPYEKRIIHTVALVDTLYFEYKYKWLDRTMFTELLAANPDAEELLLHQQGRITDSCFSNLAFYDGSNWYTPAKPLLEGVRRRFLLDNNKTIAIDIFIDDLSKFSHCSFINAMLDLGDCVLDMDTALF